MNQHTKDPVNQSLIDLEERIGLQQFGVMNNAVWHEDPKRLVFTLASSLSDLKSIITL